MRMPASKKDYSLSGLWCPPAAIRPVHVIVHLLQQRLRVVQVAAAAGAQTLQRLGTRYAGLNSRGGPLQIIGITLSRGNLL
eukprot:scaffold55383_cov16-Prasinocladus_malaysianus.AAC.1